MIRKSNISGLTDDHLLNEFDCGNNLVNNYLKTKALEDESNNIRSTTVYYDETQLVSYYTISTSIIEVKTPYDRRMFNELRSLPEDNNQSIVLPAVEISWFGVAKKYQDMHVGASMILDIFKNVIKMRHLFNLGLIGIVVGSLPDALEFYTRYNFRYLHYDYDDKQAMMIPDTYPLFVDIDSIVEIMGYLD